MSLTSFSEFIGRYLPGKHQKITINAGFMCPNRDGSKGRGGCIYCNNASFSPAYTLTGQSVVDQIEEGKRFFSRKYPAMRYLAYFQSYTSTNAPVETLIEMYDAALRCDGVDGIIIGTRPDCMPQPLLDHLGRLAQQHFVMIEYGAETACNATLSLINRCHTWDETVDAVRRTQQAGLPVGLHLILGLPGEDRKTIFDTIDAVNALGVDTVKFHQLQVVRGTELERGLAEGRYSVEQFSVDDYIELCIDILERLNPSTAVERFVSQAPEGMVVSPKWGLKNYQFTDRLKRRLSQRHQD